MRALIRVVALATAAGLGAPENAAGAFERPALDARAAALGGVLAVSPDPVFGNPARMIRSGTRASGAVGGPRRQFVFEVSRPFGLRELSEAQAGWMRPGPWSVALGGRRFGSAAYAETEARLGLARAWGSGAIGVAVRWLQVAGAGFSAHRGGAVDVGLRAELEPGLLVGAVTEAALGSVPGDPDGEGRRTSVGAARRLGPLRLHAEAQRTESAPLSVVLGAVWEPRTDLALSIGAREDPPALSGGVSLPLPASSVSAAATWVSPLGTTIRVGVRLDFGHL